MLTGAINSAADLGENDRRRDHPRFQGENLTANAALDTAARGDGGREALHARELALARLLAQGPEVVPIPGTKRRTHLRQNLAALDIKLSADEALTLARAIDDGNVQGTRYPKGQLPLLGL